jgi:hypothetical protein
MKRIGALAVLEAAVLAALSRWPEVMASAGGPSAWSWRAASEWYEAVDDPTALVCGGVVVVGLILVWLAASIALQLLADQLPARRGLRRLADSLAPRAIRRLGRSLTGATVAAGLLVGPLPEVAGPRQAPTEVPTADTATLTPVVGAGEPAPAPPLPPAATAGEDSIVVATGDCFWSIAEALVARSVANPSEREVAAYWMRLMEANRDRLVVPGVFDLVYAGQVLRVPAGDPSPAAVLPDTL